MWTMSLLHWTVGNLSFCNAVLQLNNVSTAFENEKKVNNRRDTQRLIRRRTSVHSMGAWVLLYNTSIRRLIFVHFLGAWVCGVIVGAWVCV